jgi:hypothetical protein
MVFGYIDNEKFPLSEQKKIIERVWTKEKQYNYKKICLCTSILKEEEKKDG